MKIVAWLLLVIICLMLSATVVGIVIAVPLFFLGTGMLVLSSVPSKIGWPIFFVMIVASIAYYAS